MSVRYPFACYQGSDDTFTLFVTCSLITPPLLSMRSPALSVLFLTFFALLFSVAYAAPIVYPNVPREPDCILARCEDAVVSTPGYLIAGAVV
ncbi:hypothetical protein EI94DRAFT_1722886 [Lactarius quietus]|nr:hypothetical protein EI94DRAFT_1722886 [Lactarius quietus]